MSSTSRVSRSLVMCLLRLLLLLSFTCLGLTIHTNGQQHQVEEQQQQVDGPIILNHSFIGRQLLTTNYTGTWTCGAYAECGFYSGSYNCNQYRSCTCSGGRCDPALQPPYQQPCTCQFTYRWVVGTFSTCSTTCGPGISTASATCMRSDNQPDPLGTQCAGTPTTQLPCSYGDCLRWITSDWTTCVGTGNPPCGTGSQHRNVTCWDDTTGAPYGSLACPGIIPASTQSCPLQDCYEWQESGWSPCSTTCGPGISTRSITCQDLTLGIPAPSSSYCTNPTPTTIQACSLADCYSWVSTLWSSCSATCGVGMTTRTVSCLDTTTSLTASNSLCVTHVGSQPTTQQSCTLIDCVNWVPSAWSPCSVSCGTGQQSRTYSCFDSTSGFTVSNSYCNTITPPTTTQTCVQPDCTVWQIGPYTACPDACGPSTKTRSVLCYDLTTSAIIPDTSCVTGGAGAKPVTATSCTNGGCTQWQVGAYGACSTTCGPGINTRSVYCYDTTNSVTVSNALCVTADQPSSTQPCKLADCLAWIPNSWGPCSVTCSTGSQTRTYFCQNTGTLATVPNVQCSGITPFTQQSCFPGPCTDATLGTLSIGIQPLTPPFTPTTTTYTAVVPNPVTSVAITATVHQSDASLVVTPASRSISGLVYGSPQTFTIIVTAQSGTQSTYTVTISRAPATESRLTKITTSSGAVSPAFNAANLVYSVYVPQSISSITVIGTVVDPASSVSCNTWSPAAAATTLPMSPSTSTVTCITTAQDGTTHTSYVITVTRGQSAIDTLDSLAVQSGYTLVPSFVSTTYVYTIAENVPTSTSALSFSVVATDPSCTISVTVNSGTYVSMPSGSPTSVTLNYGDNSISINVLAQDNINYLLYVISVHRLSSFAPLAAITTSASVLRPTFAPNILSYSLLLQSSDASLTLVPTAGDLYQTVTWSLSTGGSGSGPVTSVLIPTLTIQTGDSTFHITSFSEDGSSNVAYIIQIHKESTVATLSALTINVATTPGLSFATGTLSYTLSVTNAISSVQLTGTLTDPYSKFAYALDQPIPTFVPMVSGTITPVGIPLVVGDQNILVVVTSEDGTISTTYILHFHRASSDSSLAALTVSPGTFFPAFTTGGTTYTSVMVPASGSASVALTPSSSLATFTYTWNGGASQPGTVGVNVVGLTTNIGDNYFVVIVTAEDGSTHTTTQITFHQQSDDSTLTSLLVSCGPALPSFIPPTRTYALTVAANVTSTTLSLTTAYYLATVSYIFNAATNSVAMPLSSSAATSVTNSLLFGQNTFSIHVVSESGTTTSTYVIHIYRLTGAAALSSLVHNAPTVLVPSFDPAIFFYTLTMPSSSSSLTITTTSSPNAITSYSLDSNIPAVYVGSVPVIPLGIGDKSVSLVVTSEDTLHTVVYQVHVHVLSSDASLSYVGITAGLLVPSFVPTIFSYSYLIIPNVVTNTTLSMTSTYPLATVGYATLAATAATGVYVSPISGVSVPIAVPIGTSTIYVRVISEDSTQTVYTTLTLHRLSSDASLASLTTDVPSGHLAPAFDATVFDYTITGPSNKLLLGITFTQGNTQASTTYSWNGGPPTPTSGSIGSLPCLASGPNILVLVVLSEDGLFSSTYTLNYHRTAIISSLDSLTVSIGTVAPTFDPVVLIYSQTLLPVTNELTFYPNATSIYSTVMFTWFVGTTIPGSLTLTVVPASGIGPIQIPSGDSTCYFKVYAEDVSYTTIYLVHIHRISNDAQLVGITIQPFPVSTAVLTPTFTPSELNYRVDLASSVTSCTITVMANNAFATMYLNVTYGTSLIATQSLISGTASAYNPLTVGDTYHQIVVSAEDGITFAYYTVQVHRISNDATMTNITVEPSIYTIIPGVDPSVFTYSITVPFAQLSVILTPQPTSLLPKLLTVVIGWTGGYQTPLTAYSFAGVGTGEKVLPVRTLQLTQSTPYLPLIVGDTYADFRIIAEDNIAVNFYRVRVHRWSTVSTLTGLSFNPIGGGLVPHFSPTIFTYTLVQTPATTLVNFTANFIYPIMQSANFTIHWEIGNALTNTGNLVDGVSTPPLMIQPGFQSLVITLVSEDQLSEHIYTVVIDRVSSDPTITATLWSSPVQQLIPPVFTTTTVNQLVIFANTVSSIALKPTFGYYLTHVALIRQSDSTGAVLSTFNYPADQVQSPMYPLIVGNTTFILQTLAQDGVSPATYTFTLLRISNDPSIRALFIEGYDLASTDIANVSMSLTPNFSASHTSYTLWVIHDVGQITLSAYPTWYRANWAWSLATTASPVPAPTPAQWVPATGISTLIPIPPGASILRVIGTAEDGFTTLTYTVNLYRAADLTTLAVRAIPFGEGIPLTPTFTPGVMVLSTSVGFRAEGVSLKSLFVYSSSVSAWSSLAPTPIALINQTWTGAWILTAGAVTSISIQTLSDPSVITLSITRAMPLVTAVTIAATVGPTLTFTNGNLFASVVRLYNSTVPYITTVVSIIVTFTSGTVTLQNLRVDVVAHPVTSLTPVLINIVQGVNEIRMESVEDGGYSWFITRLPPDIQSLTLTGYDVTLGAISILPNLSPSFLPGVLRYTGLVHGSVRNFTLSTIYGTANTVSVGLIQEPTSALSGVWVGAPTPIGSTVTSPLYALDVGYNYFSFFSIQDGWYLFTIYRGDGDVAGIIFTGRHWDGSFHTLTSTPPFLPAQIVTRTITVPRAILDYQINVVFLTVNHSSIVVPSGIYQLTTAINSLPIPIYAGSNPLIVRSIDDGDFVYTIQKDPRDVLHTMIETVTEDNIRVEVFPLPINGTVEIPMNLTVPYRVTQLILTATFLTPFSVVIVYFDQAWGGRNFNAALNSTLLTTNVSGDPIILRVGPNVIALTSAIDGLYLYNITRLPPDLHSLVPTLDSSDPGVSVLGSEVWSTPPITFDPALFDYSAEVHYVTDTLHLTLDVFTPSSYSFTLTHPSASPINIGLSTQVCILDFPLLLGTNTLQMNSTYDGIYTWTIVRREPDVSNFFRATMRDVDSNALPFVSAISPSVFTPIFDQHVTSTSAYQLTVSFTVHSITWSVTATDPLNLLRVNPGVGTNGVIADTLIPGVDSIVYDLPTVSSYTFTLTSLFDGLYHITLIRSPVDLQTLTVTGRTFLTESVNVDLIPLFDPTIFQYNQSVPFNIGWLDLMCVHVRGDATYQVRINGVLLTPDTSNVILGPNYQTQFLAVPLQAGLWNDLQIDSLLDGTYRTSIYRALATLHSVTWTAFMLNGDVSFNSTTLLPAPDLLSDTNAYASDGSVMSIGTFTAYPYTMDVPFTVASLTVTIGWSFEPLYNIVTDLPTVSNIYPATVSQDWVLDTGAATFATPLLNGTIGSNQYDLVCGPNILRLCSAVDGCFVFTVTRAISDLTDLAVFAMQASDLSAVEISQLDLFYFMFEVPMVPNLFPGRITATTTTRTYIVTQPYLTNEIAIQAFFITFASFTVFDTTGLEHNALTSIRSVPLALIRPNVSDTIPSWSIFPLLSVQDGRFEVRVSRAAPDMPSITFKVNSVVCPTSSSSLLGTVIQWNEGPFQPGMVYHYSTSVAYGIDSLSVMAICQTTWPTAVIQISCSADPATVTTIACGSTVGLPVLQLLPGLNTIVVHSTADGTIHFNVTRVESTLQSLIFQSFALPVDVYQTRVVESPSYSSVVQVYTLTIADTIAFLRIDSTTTSLPYLSGGTVPGYTMLQLQLTDGTWIPLNNTGMDQSPMIDLPPGNQNLVISSLADGCVNLNLVRHIASELLSFNFSVDPSSGNLDLPTSQLGLQLLANASPSLSSQLQGSISQAVFLNQSNPSALLATFKTIQTAVEELCSCTVDPWNSNTTTIAPNVSSPRSIVPHPLMPPFLSGWLGPYRLRFHGDVASVDLTAVLTGASPSDLSCILNGATPIALSGPSTAITGTMQLVRGPNELRCTCTDGVYNVTLVRGRGFFSTPIWPTSRYNDSMSLYSGESTQLLTVQLTHALPLIDLQIQVLISGGNLSSSLFPLSIYGTSSFPFVYTAPIIYAASQTIALTWLPIGSSDSLEFDSPPVYLINIYPRAQFVWSGLPVFLYSYETWNTSVLTPTEGTDMGTTVLLTLTLIDAVDPSIIYSNLHSTVQSADGINSINFPLEAPTTDVTLELLIHVGISGPNAAHYDPIPDTPLEIRPRASFDITNLPASLYQTQQRVVTITPTQPPLVNTTIILKLETTRGPNGTVGWLAPPFNETDHLFDFDPIAYGGTDMFSLTFPAGSSAPISFSLLAPLLIADGTSIDLMLTILWSGLDQYHYFDIQPKLIVVSSPVHILIGGLPSTMQNRDVSTGIVTLPIRPPRFIMLSINVTILQDNMTDNPTLVPAPAPFLFQFTDLSLVQSFLLPAPYWWSRTQRMRVDYSISGPDSTIYYAPPASWITLIQQPAVVRGVEFNMHGSDDNIVSLDASLVPFRGNFYHYLNHLDVAVMSTITGQDLVPTEPTRRRLLSTGSSGSSAGGSDPAVAEPATVLHISVTTIFLQETDIPAWWNMSDAKSGNVTIIPLTLQNKQPAIYVPFVIGNNTLYVNSSLDGLYIFDFPSKIQTDASACIAAATQAGFITYEVPSTSFILEDAPTSLRSNTTSELLFCTPIADLTPRLTALSNYFQALPRVESQLADNPKTSWILYVLLIVYIGLACLSAVAVGHRDTLHGAILLAATSTSSSAGASLRGSISGTSTKSAVTRSKPPILAGTLTLLDRSDYTNVPVSDEQSRGRDEVVKITPASLHSQAPEKTNSNLSWSLRLFSLPHGLLLLCLGRAFDLTLQASFTHSVSLPVYRWCLDLPYLLLPWILTGILQQIGLLMHIEMDPHQLAQETEDFNAYLVAATGEAEEKEPTGLPTHGSYSLPIQPTNRHRKSLIIASQLWRMIDARRANSAENIFSRFAMPNFPTAIRGNLVLSVIFLGFLVLSGLVNQNQAYIYERAALNPIGIALLLITLLTIGRISVLDMMLQRRREREKQQSDENGLTIDAYAQSDRKRIQQVVRIMMVGVGLAPLILLLNTDESTLVTRTADFEAVQIVYQLIECIWISALLYLLFSAVRAERKRVLLTRYQMRGDPMKREWNEGHDLESMSSRSSISSLQSKSQSGDEEEESQSIHLREETKQPKYDAEYANAVWEALRRNSSLFVRGLITGDEFRISQLAPLLDLNLPLIELELKLIQLELEKLPAIESFHDLVELLKKARSNNLESTTGPKPPPMVEVSSQELRSVVQSHSWMLIDPEALSDVSLQPLLHLVNTDYRRSIGVEEPEDRSPNSSSTTLPTNLPQLTDWIERLEEDVKDKRSEPVDSVTGLIDWMKHESVANATLFEAANAPVGSEFAAPLVDEFRSALSTANPTGTSASVPHGWTLFEDPTVDLSPEFIQPLMLRAAKARSNAQRTKKRIDEEFTQKGKQAKDIAEVCDTIFPQPPPPPVLPPNFESSISRALPSESHTSDPPTSNNRLRYHAWHLLDEPANGGTPLMLPSAFPSLSPKVKRNRPPVPQLMKKLPQSLQTPTFTDIALRVRQARRIDVESRSTYAQQQQEPRPAQALKWHQLPLGPVSMSQTELNLEMEARAGIIPHVEPIPEPAAVNSEENKEENLEQTPEEKSTADVQAYKSYESGSTPVIVAAASSDESTVLPLETGSLPHLSLGPTAFSVCAPTLTVAVDETAYACALVSPLHTPSNSSPLMSPSHIDFTLTTSPSNGSRISPNLSAPPSPMSTIMELPQRTSPTEPILVRSPSIGRGRLMQQRSLIAMTHSRSGSSQLTPSSDASSTPPFLSLTRVGSVRGFGSGVSRLVPTTATAGSAIPNRRTIATHSISQPDMIDRPHSVDRESSLTSSPHGRPSRRRLIPGILDQDENN